MHPGVLSLVGARANVAPMLSRTHRRWPATAAAMRELCGGRGVWSSLWNCEEAWGASLVDPVGGVTLAPVTSPRWREAGAYPGDLAVGYDSGAGDSFHAASTVTYDLDAATSIALFCCIRFSTLLNRYVMGKGPGANQWGLQLQSSNSRMQAVVQSSVGGFFLCDVVADAYQGGTGPFHDALFTIDRAGQRMQLFTEQGAGAAVDISACGTLSNAFPFHLGAPTSATTTGCEIAFAAVATGEVDVLRANGAAVIAAIRAATGRA